MNPVVERFLKYVSFETKSDEFPETCPSTQSQRVLGAALVEEMKISTPDSKVEVWVVPTNEELMIAQDTAELVNAAK